MEKQTISLTVNGQPYEFLIGEKFGMIPPSETLVQTLRRRLELTGTLRLLYGDQGRQGRGQLHDPDRGV